MDLEIIILNELSQTKTNTIEYHFFVNTKNDQVNRKTVIYKTERLTDIENKLMVTKEETGERNKLGFQD